MTGTLWTPVARAFRGAALPLAAYYAITLAVPLANGAAHSGTTFVEHALVVLVVPPVIIVLAWAVHTLTRKLLHVVAARQVARSQRFCGLNLQTAPRRAYGGEQTDTYRSAP